MSTVKTQKLSNAPARAKRVKGPASKTATANRDLFGDDSTTGPTAPAKRAGSGPAKKRATAARGAAPTQRAKAAPKRVPASVGSVRINFDLEKTVHKRLKMLAVEADMTIADWMRQMIQRELLHAEKMEQRRAK